MARLVKANAMMCGVALSPRTDMPAELTKLVEENLVDMVLVMTVEPGFGGQAFNQDMVDKVKAVRSACGPYVRIQVRSSMWRSISLALCAPHSRSFQCKEEKRNLRVELTPHTRAFHPCMPWGIYLCEQRVVCACRRLMAALTQKLSGHVPRLARTLSLLAQLSIRAILPAKCVHA